MKINLSAYESRVLWFIFRKTYGWKKKEDWLSLSQFSGCIGLDRRLVHRALKGLEAKNIIIINRDDRERPRYGFQKNYKKWKSTTVINRDDKLSSKEMTQLSSKEIPTKDNYTKEKKRGGNIPPSIQEISDYCRERNNGIDPNHFFDFYEAKNWMIGKNKMKDWMAAVRTWEAREPKQAKAASW